MPQLNKRLITSYINPMLLGSLFGGSLGASSGRYIGQQRYGSDKGQKKKYTIGGALLGSVLGAAGGFGFNKLLINQARAQKSDWKKWKKAWRKSYEDFADDSFKDFFRGGGYHRASGSPSLYKKMDVPSTLKKLFKTSKSNIKSKADLRKVYYGMAKKVHPDILPPSMKIKGEADFKNLSNAYENLQQTDWFNKLSFYLKSFDNELEKIGGNVHIRSSIPLLYVAPTGALGLLGHSLGSLIGEIAGRRYRKSDPKKYAKSINIGSLIGTPLGMLSGALLGRKLVGREILGRRLGG